MNGYYDQQHPEQKKAKGPEYPEYDDTIEIANSDNTRKVFINLAVENLDKEYQRICDLGIGINLTPIRYLQVFSPYWYFTFMDPDGNPIEITGGHEEKINNRKMEVLLEVLQTICITREYTYE